MNRSARTVSYSLAHNKGEGKCRKTEGNRGNLRGPVHSQWRGKLWDRFVGIYMAHIISSFGSNWFTAAICYCQFDCSSFSSGGKCQKLISGRSRGILSCGRIENRPLKLQLLAESDQYPSHRFDIDTYLAVGKSFAFPYIFLSFPWIFLHLHTTNAAMQMPWHKRSIWGCNFICLSWNIPPPCIPPFFPYLSSFDFENQTNLTATSQKCIQTELPNRAG